MIKVGTPRDFKDHRPYELHLRHVVEWNVDEKRITAQWYHVLKRLVVRTLDGTLSVVPDTRNSIQIKAT